MFSQRLNDAGVPTVIGQENIDADSRKRQDEFQAKMAAEKRRLEEAEEARQKSIAEAKAEYQRKEKEEFQLIRERRAELEEKAKQWQQEHEHSNKATDEMLDFDAEDGVGVGLDQIEPRTKEDGSVAFANPLSMESEHHVFQSDDPGGSLAIDPTA